VLLAAAVSASTAEDELAGTGLREEAVVRLRSVGLRIEPRTADDARVCAGLGLDDLDVELRGEAVDRRWLIELDREKRPALHVLLLDTSRSIEDWLDYVREAAEAYVAQLDLERDRVMLATFDDSLVLVSPPTSDKTALGAAIRGVRMGSWTSLVDGLYYLMLELEAQPARPVVVLLTDGVDSISFHDRLDVNRLAEAHPDLIAFTMGIDVPFLSRNLPPGVASSKRFLQRLADRTDGRYFDQPTGFRLSGAFDEIRALLDAEAVLTLADPEPEAAPGRIRVASRDPACRVVTYREAEPFDDDTRHEPIGPPYPEPPLSLPLAPDPKYRVEYIKSRDQGLDAGCADRDADGIPLWNVAVEPGRIRACALDVTIEEGPLYDFYSSRRSRFNSWLEQSTRSLTIDVVAPDRLPRAPEELMDVLADHAVSLLGMPVRTGALQVPVERHARPYHDWPMFCNGKVFFHIRARLAHGLFAHEPYREWVLSKLAREAQQEIDALKERLREHAPQLDETRLEEIARLSERGQAILNRASSPAEVDVQHYLAAWLGDISAAELFEGWERRRVDDLIASDGVAPIDTFLERWTALRGMFFVPSYARVLTLLAPVHDPERDLIGYWRVVLPRPSWLGQRVKGWKNRVDYSDLPLDLIPDEPLALRTLSGMFEGDSRLHPHLARRGYRVESIEYELLGKAWTRGPERAFRDARVRLALAAQEGDEAARAVLTVAADYESDSDGIPPTLRDLHFDVTGDAELAAMIEIGAGGR